VSSCIMWPWWWTFYCWYVTSRCTLTSDPLTLDVCSTSGVTWSNSVPNLNEIEQSAAKLLRIICWKFVSDRTPSLPSMWNRCSQFSDLERPIMHRLHWLSYWSLTSRIFGAILYRLFRGVGEDTYIKFGE